MSKSSTHTPPHPMVAPPWETAAERGRLLEDVDDLASTLHLVLAWHKAIQKFPNSTVEFPEQDILSSLTRCGLRGDENDAIARAIARAKGEA